MYITIAPQNLQGNFSTSVCDLVAYLEKENEGKPIEEMNYFFDQNDDKISDKNVINGIDQNTAKLKKIEPKFYSITVNPSANELQILRNPNYDLKQYVREIMKDYASSFNREINGKPITVSDIKYYAKIEHERVYKYHDKVIRENAPFYSQILALRNEKHQLAKSQANNTKILSIKHKIASIDKLVPHKINGQIIVQGMPKEGSQSHVHIIVSRKDVSNSFSLSPGSKYKSSQTIFNGKEVKRGFNRDQFFERSEKTFDRMFGYERNYVSTYEARKTFVKDPKKYFAIIMGLPTNERSVAFKLLSQSGFSTKGLNIPTNKVQLAIKVINQLKKGLNVAIRSSSIGI